MPNNLDLGQLVIITEDSDIQPIGCIFELEDLSINIPKSYTVWFGNMSTEMEDLINAGGLVIKSNNSNLITDVDSDSNIITSNETIYQTSGIHVLFESKQQKIETTILSAYDGDTKLFDFSFKQRYIDLMDRLYVAANNYGVQINEDWNRAFYESDIHESNFDFVLHNRKLSEFLLYAFELIGLRGSYKTFFAAINYFGYKDILWFEETWINKDKQRRLTEINNQLIDEHFVKDGYTKIGELIMFYSLDKLEDEEPYDEGGLPQYEYRNISYKDLYTKLVILRKILQDWFLPYDVYITSIIGEFHGVAGLQKKIWTAEDIFLNLDEHSRFDFMDIEWDGSYEKDSKKYAFIMERKFIADVNLFSVINDKLVLNQTETSHLKESLLKLEKIDDEITDLNDYDILTKFFVQDIAVLNQKITIHSEIPDYIYGFKLRLIKIENNTQKVLFLSNLIPIEDLFDIIRLGIRELGDFEISITAFDKYGYTKSWSEKFSIIQETIALDFLTLRPEYINLDSDYWKRFLHFETPQDSSILEGIPIVDAIDYDKWNINYPDDLTDDIRIARRYHHIGNPIDSSIIRNKRNILVSQLDKTPISENWNPYHICFIKLKHDTNFSISIKTFPHWEYETVEYENEAQFIDQLSELSKDPNSSFYFFDFDIQMLNEIYRERLIIDEMETSSPVLVIFDKMKSFTLDSVIFKIDIDGNTYTNDAGADVNPTTLIKNLDKNVIHHNRIFPSFGYDPMIRFNYFIDGYENIDTTQTMDFHIRMKIGNVEIVSEKEYGSNDASSEPQFSFGILKNILKNILPESTFEELEIYYSFDTFTIRHKYGDYIEFSHISLGHKLASRRDGSIKKMYYTVAGSSFQLGSMIILMPNEDIKINTQDVEWIIRDTFTGYKYVESKNYVCKWIAYRGGLYDVECITTDKLTNKKISAKKQACIMVE